MRVLTVGNLYPPHHFGGYELVWESAVEHWREAGHDVRVLASDYRHTAGPVGDVPEGRDVHRDLRWYWHDHDFPPLSLSARLALERDNAAVFARHLDELRPDIVTWWSMGGMSLSLIDHACRRGLPALAVVHDLWVLYGPRVDAWTRAWRNHPRLAPLVRRMTGLPTGFDPDAVSEWSFNSELMRDQTLAGAPDLRNTSVISPGIDDSVFRPSPPTDWAWRLVYVGRVESRKGIDTALTALVRLPPETTLTVVGDGDDSYLAALRALAAQVGVEGRVSFEPGRPRAALAAAYAAADAVVFPVTWEEPWGLVPLEAMAVGRPVVATGTGGSSEYLRDGANCLLFPPRDAVALAAAVRRLGEDADLREALREGGTATAALHTERRFNADLEQALHRVAALRAP